MASPVAHGLAAVALVWLAGRRPPPTADSALAHRPVGRAHELTTAVITAVAADFDFIPGLVIGDAGAFHRGPTHSLAAAAVFGAVAFLAARRWDLPSPGRIALVLGIVFASHLGIDLLTTDYGEPSGVPLFWPVSSQNVSLPVHLFVYIRHTGEDGGLAPALFSAHNARAILREALIMGPVLAAARLARKSLRSTT